MDTKLTLLSLILSSALTVLPILFSYKQKLGLEKDILIGLVRAVIQLIFIGYILTFVFGIDNAIITLTLILIMIFNASITSSKRVSKIKKAFIISFISIAVGTIITEGVLILSGTINFQPNKIIPISGMIISNSMVSISLCFRALETGFKTKHKEVEIKLALGADIHLSSQNILKDSIKTGMIPTIDSTKTLGIVALPGMMTGLILAGASPLDGIKYQIIVTFMILSSTSIASFTSCYLSYKSFFNTNKQLI